MRRPDCAATTRQARFSPRPKRIPHVRKLTSQGSLGYFTNNTNRLDTREVNGQFQTEFTNSDVAIVSYTDNFERLVRAVRDRHRRPPAGRRLQLPHDARRVSGRAAAEGIRHRDLRDRHVLQRRPAVDCRQLGARRRSRRSCRSSRACRSTGWTCVQGSFTAKVVRSRVTYTMTPRMFVSGIVQYNSSTRSMGSNLRFRWEYLAGQRALRRLHRRLRPAGGGRCRGAAEPGFRDQAESAAADMILDRVAGSRGSRCILSVPARQMFSHVRKWRNGRRASLRS